MCHQLCFLEVTLTPYSFLLFLSSLEFLEKRITRFVVFLLFILMNFLAIDVL